MKRFMIATIPAGDDTCDLDVAVATFTDEEAAQVVRRIRFLETLRAQPEHAHLDEMVYSDIPVSFYSYADSLLWEEDKSDFERFAAHIVNGRIQNWVLLPDDIKYPDDDEQRTGYIEAFIAMDGISWDAQPKHADGVVMTDALPVSALEPTANLVYRRLETDEEAECPLCESDAEHGEPVSRWGCDGLDGYAVGCDVHAVDVLDNARMLASQKRDA